MFGCVRQSLLAAHRGRVGLLTLKPHLPDKCHCEGELAKSILSRVTTATPIANSIGMRGSDRRGGQPGRSRARTYLENRLRMRPLGVVSKKLIGERKMAKAIRSCSFRLA